MKLRLISMRAMNFLVLGLVAALAGIAREAKAADKPHLVIVTAEDEYHSEATIPAFADKYLKDQFRISVVTGNPSDRHRIDGIEKLRDADVAIFAIRRRLLPKEQLDVVREYLAAGKPLVALRVTSHAFSPLGGEALPEGHDQWLTFDKDVLGAHYDGHWGNKGGDGARTYVWTAEGAGKHPILVGVDPARHVVPSWLYKNRDLGEKTEVLLEGQVESNPTIEPVAWTNITKWNGKVFYTMLGHPQEFEMPAFQQLLLNAIGWAAQVPITAKVTEAGTPAADGQAQSWRKLPVPGNWELAGGELANYDGFAWYRCWVKLPSAWKDRQLHLLTSQVDDAHEVYFQGQRIGSQGSLPPQPHSASGASGVFEVPAELVRPDDWNLVTIRIYDMGGRGGFKGPAPRLAADQEQIDLSGAWQFRTGDDLAWAKPVTPDDASPRFEKVTELPRDARRGMAPEVAAKMFNLPENLEMQLLLSEPGISQPLHISFDERGRLWLVEYRQYPNPAGLKIVSRDNFWRNVYDKVPPAPPNHFRGKDKITIHEDTDGDGVYDSHKTFIEGLSLVTSVARGRGGVWVLNPPYLLFYPDKDNDDVPDGDPELHLSGFGIEDSHSIANSLRFGPDGWLYAAQGSTVTADVRRAGIDAADKPGVKGVGQLIWRYHPETRRFEIFAEGGGNAFGCEIDAEGRIFSGHNGGDTRGFHYLQGAYLQKGFNKHGPLSNPYSFGYFPAMKHASVPRFTHEFVIYDGGALPEEYNGRLFGVAPLLNYVCITDRLPNGSTFQTVDVGYIHSTDHWFRPVDIAIGPDGAMYVADWYDEQCNHYLNHEGRIDPTSGRVYRLQARGTKPARPVDLSKKTSAELVALLSDKNIWVRQTVLRMLGDRRDASVIPLLASLLDGDDKVHTLDVFWALYQTAGPTEAVLTRGLAHQNPFIRLWAARLLGDDHKASPALADRLIELCASEPNLEVRAQLACTARRLPVDVCLPMVAALAAHREDLNDPQIPLLLWWALESKCAEHPEALVKLVSDPQMASLSIVRAHILSRLMQRYATSGKRGDLLVCAQLFRAVGKENAPQLMQGFEAAYRGRTPNQLPIELVSAMAESGAAGLTLRVRLQEPAAVKEALETLTRSEVAAQLRQECIVVLSEMKNPDAVAPLLKLVDSEPDANVRRAALVALSGYGNDEIPKRVLAVYENLPIDLQGVAQNLLASRPQASLALLKAVEAGQIEAHDLPLPIVRKILLHKDAQLDALVERLWGDELGDRSRLLKERRAHLEKVVAQGSGSPYGGKILFNQNCAKCHTLFSEGGQVGPDLTTYKREDVNNILLHIVDPNAEIREGFETYAVLTDDGRALNGFLADQDEQILVLKGFDGASTVIAREEVESMRATGQSLMPEGILDTLTDQQVRDLLAYLRSTQPLAN